MSADARCGIDLDAAVDTHDSIDPADDDPVRTTSDVPIGAAGLGSTDADDEESVATTVVSAVADAKGVDPLDLDPLYDVVDGDALEAMFAARDGSSDLEVRFSMAGCEVVVRAGGSVTVTPPTRRETAETAPSHGD